MFLKSVVIRVIVHNTEYIKQKLKVDGRQISDVNIHYINEPPPKKVILEILVSKDECTLSILFLLNFQGPKVIIHELVYWLTIAISL